MIKILKHSVVLLLLSGTMADVTHDDSTTAKDSDNKAVTSV